MGALDGYCASAPSVSVAASAIRQHLGVILLQYAPQSSSKRSGRYSDAATGNDMASITAAIRLVLYFFAFCWRYMDLLRK